MAGTIWMRQDACTMKCRQDQHLHCCLPGMNFSRNFRWALWIGLAWAAPEISYRACVIWVMQMQVDCNGVAGCPSNNPASWKLWAWKTPRDIAEECWRQGAQWLSAQTILLKHPGPGADPLQATRETFSTPGEVPPLCVPTSPPFPGHTTLCCLLRGRKKTVQWMKKRLNSHLQLPEEMGQVQNRRPWANSAAEARHLAVFPIRTCRAHLLLLGPRVPVAAVASINKVSIPG